MARFIILVAVLGIALIAWYKIKNAKGEEKRKMVMYSAIGGVLALLAILAATGHLNIITAAIASLFALLPRFAGLLRYLPFIKKLYDQRQQGQQYGGQGNNQNGNRGGQQAARQTAMGRSEAMDVLGLKEGFTRDDVIQAHRRMMQKVHPDRGGSDYLASQINKAKDTLLG